MDNSESITVEYDGKQFLVKSSVAHELNITNGYIIKTQKELWDINDANFARSLSECISKGKKMG